MCRSTDSIRGCQRYLLRWLLAISTCVRCSTAHRLFDACSTEINESAQWKRDSAARGTLLDPSDQLCRETHTIDANGGSTVPSIAWAISSWRMHLRRLWVIINASGWSTNGTLFASVSMEQGTVSLLLQTYVAVFLFRPLFLYSEMKYEPRSTTKQQFKKQRNWNTGW